MNASDAAAGGRLKDWEARLDAVLVDWAKREHRLGRCDCGAFAGAWVEAMTGDNPWTPLAGRYATELGWLRAIRRHGWRDLPAAAASVGREIAPLLARRGDLAFDGSALGGMVATGMLRMAETGGLVVVPRHHIERAWRIA